MGCVCVAWTRINSIGQINKLSIASGLMWVGSPKFLPFNVFVFIFSPSHCPGWSVETALQAELHCRKELGTDSPDVCMCTDVYKTYQTALTDAQRLTSVNHRDMMHAMRLYLKGRCKTERLYTTKMQPLLHRGDSDKRRSSFHLEEILWIIQTV